MRVRPFLLFVLWMLVICLPAFLSSCGGAGGGGSTAVIGTVVPAGPYKQRFTVSYFGCITNYIEQPASNGFWSGDGTCTGGVYWPLALAQEALAAKTMGATTFVVHLPHGAAYKYETPLVSMTGEQRLADLDRLLDQVDQMGVLAGFQEVVFYPMDEPDIHLSGDVAGTVADGNRWLHAKIKSMKTVANGKIGVIFNCDNVQTKPGMRGARDEVFDIFGCDRYGDGAKIVGAYDELLAYSQYEDTELWTVIGGSSPWKTDPGPFLNYGSNRKRVAGHVFFRHDPTYKNGGSVGQPQDLQYEGIRTNGMKKLFCEAALSVSQKPGVVCN